MKTFFLASLLASMAFDSAQAAIELPRHLIDPGRPQIEEPENVIQRFNEAVDRGELTVYGRTLKRSMIVPLRVEYVYDLASRAMLIRVYSDLKTPLPVPERECKVRALGAIMQDGRVVEIESHIWMDD